MNKNNGQLQNSCYNRLSSTTTIYYSHKIQMTIFDLFLITTNKPVHVNSNNRKQTSFSCCFSEHLIPRTSTNLPQTLTVHEDALTHRRYSFSNYG